MSYMWQCGVNKLNWTEMKSYRIENSAAMIQPALTITALFLRHTHYSVQGSKQYYIKVEVLHIFLLLKACTVDGFHLSFLFFMFAIIINGDTISEHLAFLQLPCTKLIMDMLNTQSLWALGILFLTLSTCRMARGYFSPMNINLKHSSLMIAYNATQKGDWTHMTRGLKASLKNSIRHKNMPCFASYFFFFL